jgi:hypothetical protein
MRTHLNLFSKPPRLNFFSRPPRPPVVGDIAGQLRELPSEIAPPYDFAEFQRRSRERSAPKRHVVTWPYAAAAAGLTAFVASMALLGTNDRSGPGANERAAPGSRVAMTVAPGEQPSASAISPGSTDAAAGAANAAVANAAVANAVAANEDSAQHAREAREWLARQPAEPAVVRAGPRLTVVSLEDRIAWFDDALTDGRLSGASPDQLKVLQQQRALLVSSLAQVRYAEALVAGGS